MSWPPEKKKKHINQQIQRINPKNELVVSKLCRSIASRCCALQVLRRASSSDAVVQLTVMCMNETSAFRNSCVLHLRSLSYCTCLRELNGVCAHRCFYIVTHEQTLMFYLWSYCEQTPTVGTDFCDFCGAFVR